LMYSMRRSRLNGANLLKNFYVRRIYRIYPLSILTVLTALILGLDSDIKGIAGLSSASLPGKLTIISNFLLIQNIVSAKSIVNVLWSLPFELQMYLFLPLLFFWTRRRQGFWPLIGSWPLAVIMACVQPHLKLLQHFSILRFLPNF